MKPKTFMVIAGEASGDANAADLVRALRQEFTSAPAIRTNDNQPLKTSLEPRFFGAGGPRMAREGVELAFDLTQHSVIGVSDVLKKYFEFRKLFNQLYKLALERQPDCIICVDFFGFNGRFLHAIRKSIRNQQPWFHGWHPKLVQYVSPQVWASRAGRAYQLEEDVDLLLSIIPFERDWYAARTPRLEVEFVGNPIVDKYPSKPTRTSASGTKSLLLLPGSRPSEIARHLPVLIASLGQIRSAEPNLAVTLVLPNEALAQQARSVGLPSFIGVRIGELGEELSKADAAIASTGTVTLECAWFGVPTVAIYKTSFFTYHIAKSIVTVKHLAMPNLLAKEEVSPEFIQDAATAQNIAEAALKLLRDESLRSRIRQKLAAVADSLGPPGASRRAAQKIYQLVCGSN